MQINGFTPFQPIYKNTEQETISLTFTCIRAAFAGTDPKSAKKTDNLTVFFALLGSGDVKAASEC